MTAIILILMFNIYLTIFDGLNESEKKQPTNFTKIFCVRCINTFTWIAWSSTSLLRSTIFCSSVFTCHWVSAHDRVRWSSFIWMLTKANIGYSKKTKRQGNNFGIKCKCYFYCFILQCVYLSEDKELS